MLKIPSLGRPVTPANEETIISTTIPGPSVSPHRTAIHRSWRWAGACTLLVSALSLAMFSDTARLMASTWISSRTYSHGLLIGPIFVYLVWERRRHLAALQPMPNYWGLAVLVIVAGLWLLGSLGDVRVVQQFALVAMLDIIIWTVFGTRVVQVLWFPLALLFFAVPFGDSVVGPLQDFTANFTVALLRLSHVPVVQENRNIWVPSGAWVVEEACSGIRYLISSVVLGLIYAKLIYRSNVRRALFILASMAVPIIANSIRAYMIVLLGYLTDNRIAAGVDHIIYGWILFTMIQLLLFSVGLVWRERPAEELQLLNRSRMSSSSFANSPRAIAIASLCALICVSSAPVAESYFLRRAVSESPPRLTLIVNSPWQEVSSSHDHSWVPRLYPQSEVTDSYGYENERTDIYLASYSPKQSLQLVQGFNQLSNPKLWSEVASGVRTVVMDGKTADVRWDEIQSASTSRLVWTWYYIGGKSTTSPLRVKLLQAEARLLTRPTVSAVIAISAEYVLNPSEATTKLQDFLNHISIVQTPAPSSTSAP